jgi:hypothetical protein
MTGNTCAVFSCTWARCWGIGSTGGSSWTRIAVCGPSASGKRILTPRVLSICSLGNFLMGIILGSVLESEPTSCGWSAITLSILFGAKNIFGKTITQLYLLTFSPKVVPGKQQVCFWARLDLRFSCLGTSPLGCLGSPFRFCI